MPPVNQYETQFQRQWNTHVENLTISQKCHLLGVMAIQMECDQSNPAEGYTLIDADKEHPFAEPATKGAIGLLNISSPEELMEWAAEIVAAIQTELQD